MLDLAWGQLEDVRSEVQEHEEAIEVWLGSPPDFAAMPDPLLPAAVEKRIHAGYDPRTTRLHWVDCHEAPCIAVLELVGLCGPAQWPV